MNIPAIVDERDGMLLMALGSNLGDSPVVIRAAMQRIEQLAQRSGRRSSLWSSSPVECPPGSPRFVNAAMMLPLPTLFSPDRWLTTMQALEREFGRSAKIVMNEARSLDLDIISWGSVIQTSPALTLPHPRAAIRQFVLQPLSELCPNVVLPGQSRSITQLLGDCPPDPLLKRIE